MLVAASPRSLDGPPVSDLGCWITLRNVNCAAAPQRRTRDSTRVADDTPMDWALCQEFATIYFNRRPYAAPRRCAGIQMLCCVTTDSRVYEEPAAAALRSGAGVSHQQAAVLRCYDANREMFHSLARSHSVNGTGECNHAE